MAIVPTVEVLAQHLATYKARVGTRGQQIAKKADNNRSVLIQNDGPGVVYVGGEEVLHGAVGDAGFKVAVDAYGPTFHGAYSVYARAADPANEIRIGKDTL